MTRDPITDIQRGPGVIHCQPCDDEPRSRWRAAVVYLTFPPTPAHPDGAYEPAHVCDLCLWDAINGGIRDGYPMTITPLEATP